MEKLKWTTEKVKVCDLIPATDNPRQWRETGEAELDDSLQKFDLVEIPVADFDNTLIAGHRRMERLIAAGRANELIDVRKPNRQLTTEERKEYMLRSNIHQGEWDAEKLTEAFEGFDFEGLGMDVAGLPDPPKVLPSGEDDYIIPDRIQTDIVAGDLFEFRKGDLCHRLLCGDSTIVDDVEKLMGGRKADMVFTDPPYGVNVKGGGKNNTSIAGDITQTVIPFSFDLAVHVATNAKARFYFCGSEVNIGLYLKLFDRNLRQLPRHLIWVKNGFVMKPNNYHNGYEIIFFGYKEGGGSLKYWYGERTEEFASDIWKISRDSFNDYLHPTQKPIDLALRAINNSSTIGHIVYEPFGGSGSTLIAAHQLSRNCYGMELDPHYCQVIVDRMLNYDPELEVTRNGKPYEPKHVQK